MIGQAYKTNISICEHWINIINLKHESKKLLTSKRYCARAGHRGQGASSNTFVNPSIFFGGLHDHQ